MKEKWEKNISNPDEIAINKLLSTYIDPTENNHNADQVNKINKGIIKLFKINDNNKITLNLKGIESIQISKIIYININELNELFNKIYHILIYNEAIDDTTPDPNKRVKNGPSILYNNIPRLNSSHINRIIKTIGKPGNRKKLDPDSEEHCNNLDNCYISLQNLKITYIGI